MKGLQRKLSAAFFTLAGWAMALPAMAQIPTSGAGFSEINSSLGTESPQEIIGSIINVALGFLAFVAVIIILLGGFRWMTAAGNDDQVASAKRLLVAAVIGLVIIFAAWGISIYAIQEIGTATGATLG